MSPDNDVVVSALTRAITDCNRMIDTEPGEQFWVGRMSALLLALDLLTRDDSYPCGNCGGALVVVVGQTFCTDCGTRHANEPDAAREVAE